MIFMYINEHGQRAFYATDYDQIQEYSHFTRYTNYIGIGWFDAVYLPNDTVLIVDDEGILKDMNQTAYDGYNGQILYGPIGILKRQGEDLIPPTEEQYLTFDKWVRLFREWPTGKAVF